MKMIFYIFLFIIFTSNVMSQTAPSFCSDAQLDMTPTSENCLTTCSSVANYPSSQLSSGSSGFCIGQTSYSKFYIYKLKLGKTSSGTNSLCTILDDIIPITQPAIDGTSTAKNITFNLQNCDDGTYDVLHIIMSRYTAFSGNTVFPNPDGTGSNPKKVRTTSTFSNSTPELITSSDWLESSTTYSNNNLEYVRPSASWNTIFKKLANTPSSVDLANNSDFIMYYDELKGTSINDSGIYSDWFCESSSLCYRQDPLDVNQMEMRITSSLSDVVSGLPLELKKNNKCNLDFDVDFYATDRTNNEEMGIKFLWYNNAGTLQYLGAYPAENGMYITIGKPTC